MRPSGTPVKGEHTNSSPCSHISNGLGGVAGSGAEEAPGFLAVILPDEYADATAASSMEELLRAPNLLVLEARRDIADEVVIRSDR